MTKRRNLNTENVDACFAENEFAGSAPHKNECKTAMQRKSQHEARHEHRESRGQCQTLIIVSRNSY